MFRKLLFILLFFSQTIFASSLNCKQPALPHSFRADNNNEKTTIISENNSIEIYDKKAFYMNFYFGKEVLVKICDSAGLKAYSQFYLQEALDKNFIYHSTELTNSKHFFDGIELKYLEMEINKKNTGFSKALYYQTTENISCIGFDQKIDNYSIVKIYIQNLGIGDIIKIKYRYAVPFRKNMTKLVSFRYFFNDEFQKKQFKLKISFEEGLNTNVYLINNSKADTTYTVKGIKTYIWERKDLPGCLKEAGGRPYLELPYIFVTTQPLELFYMIPNSFVVKEIPLYAIAAMSRENSFLIYELGVEAGSKTKRYLLADDFIEKQTKEISSDSTGFVKLNKINNTIVDEFSYDNSEDLFLPEIPLDDPFCNLLNTSALSNINRYDLYAMLISKLGFQFYTAYPVDKRIGEINNHFVNSMFNSDFLLGIIMKTGNIQLLYPKKSRYGYYLGETPFYFENVKTRLISMLDYREAKMAIGENFRSMISPGSTVIDNERKNNIKVDINLEKSSAIFDARISLSGQYSTLLRGNYLYNVIDETVNPLYNKKVWEFSKRTKLIRSEVVKVEKFFPYKVEIKSSYSCDSLVTKTGDQTYSLNLSNWFNHIIYTNMDTANRVLNFYTDFLGKDSYNYYLSFDKNVHLAKNFSKIEINNEFGILQIDCINVQPNVIKLSSNYIVRNEKITSDKINSVAQIFSSIEALNKSKMELISE